MKQEAPAVRAFIRDYKLEKPNGIICFTASVHFHAKEIWFKFMSHVHIITIAYKHLDVIYLLNPQIDEKEIKTMFTDNKVFSYSRTRRFEIKGKSEQYGTYTISIIPINNDCEKAIMTELHAKMHN